MAAALLCLTAFTACGGESVTENSSAPEIETAEVTTAATEDAAAGTTDTAETAAETTAAAETTVDEAAETVVGQ